MFRHFSLCVPALLLCCACRSQTYTPPFSMKLDDYYQRNKGDSLTSIMTGTEGNGTLQHAKMLPFCGTNFHYYDSASYVQGRAFMSDKMANTLVASYKEMETLAPGRTFMYMESGLRDGGPIAGHRTHQNGLSIDLAIPLQKNGQPYYGLDSTGGAHYLLEFDDKGRYSNDSTITIDFNLLGQQILSLDRQARKNGLRIKKVILRLELKDEFYATANGKKVRARGIYLAMNLPPEVNRQHDDHFHVDFESLA